MSKKARVYQLETTNYCNATCSYCPHGSMTREKGFVSMTTVNQVITNCTQTGQDYIALHHMGEPLMHPNIGEILLKFYRASIKTEISTNGWMLGSKGIEILESKISLVRIAIDFFYKDPNYLDMIENFLEVAMRYPETRVRIHTVDGNDLSRFAKYNNGNLLLEKKVFDNWGGQVVGDSQLEKGQGCYFKKYNYVVVLWNGDIVPCCLDYNGTYVIGHVDNLATVQSTSCKLCNTCQQLQFADGGGWKE